MHPLHEVHDVPPCCEQLPRLHAFPSSLKADAHASNGPMQPFTCTTTLPPPAPPSIGSSSPERHRFSERTHASLARYESAPGNPATLGFAGGGMQPSASTHCATLAMLVRASRHISSTRWDVPPSSDPTRNSHSLRPSEKSVSVALESHAPPARHVSHRDVTSATHAASVGYGWNGLPCRVSCRGGGASATASPVRTSPDRPASPVSRADITTSHAALTYTESP